MAPYELREVHSTEHGWLLLAEAHPLELKCERDTVGCLKSMRGAGLKESEVRSSGLSLCSVSTFLCVLVFLSLTSDMLPAYVGK